MSLDALPVQETAEKLKLPTPEELYRYLDDLRRSCGGERVQFTGSNGNAGKTVTVNIDQRFFPIGRVLAHDTPLAFCVDRESTDVVGLVEFPWRDTPIAYVGSDTLLTFGLDGVSVELLGGTTYDVQDYNGDHRGRIRHLAENSEERSLLFRITDPKGSFCIYVRSDGLVRALDSDQSKIYLDSSGNLTEEKESDVARTRKEPIYDGTAPTIVTVTIREFIAEVLQTPFGQIPGLFKRGRTRQTMVEQITGYRDELYTEKHVNKFALLSERPEIDLGPERMPKYEIAASMLRLLNDGLKELEKVRAERGWQTKSLTHVADIGATK